MFTREDDKFGGRKWRWWPYFDAWRWTLSAGAQLQMIRFGGKDQKPHPIRIYSLNLRLLPWQWKFGAGHMYYDGPHCSLDLGPLFLYWNPRWCKKCMPESC